MVLIRRRFGDDERAPDDEGTEDVGEGFHRIRDERVRMAENVMGCIVRDVREY